VMVEPKELVRCSRRTAMDLTALAPHSSERGYGFDGCALRRPSAVSFASLRSFGTPVRRS